MRGPTILARTMSIPTKRGKERKAWQYHSRSDNHSKIACWCLLFDALLECEVLRDHAARGRLGFGINYVMVGPINKTLDLVVTLVPPERELRSRRTFADLVDVFGIALEAQEKRVLADLPHMEEDTKLDASEVAIALEAKACMTEHIKSLPRLHAEILATGYLAKRAVPGCITVCHALVNGAETFVTPSGKGKRNRHTQPAEARRVVDMLSSAVPLARDTRGFGYDVIGVTVLECRNDGSPVTVSSSAAAPAMNDHVHYDRMVRSLCSEYRSRFR